MSDPIGLKKLIQNPMSESRGFHRATGGPLKARPDCTDSNQSVCKVPAFCDRFLQRHGGGL